MGLPGHHTSKRSKRVRASHFALKKVNLFKCPNCQKPILAHCACKSCGFYKGVDALRISKKLDKKTKKKLEKRKEKQSAKA